MKPFFGVSDFRIWLLAKCGSLSGNDYDKGPLFQTNMEAHKAPYKDNNLTKSEYLGLLWKGYCHLKALCRNEKHGLCIWGGVPRCSSKRRMMHE